MDRIRMQKILEQVSAGELSVSAAMENLKTLPYEDVGCARVDTHRGLRDNLPEVIFCPGKTPEEVAVIIDAIARNGDRVLATRADSGIFALVKERVVQAVFHERARIITVGDPPPLAAEKEVAVLTAGTADTGVAEEAAVCLEFAGVKATRIYDVGVAGLHRLLDRLDDINRARVVIVAAGMEGALPSVVGGLTSRPVVAVPTSVGYGSSFGGVAALLAMLNTCASGVGVVNIDNGYGAAALALAILNSSR